MVAGDTPRMDYHLIQEGVDNDTPSSLMPLELIQTRHKAQNLKTQSNSDLYKLYT